jgi:hypothetical protein
MGSGTGSSKSNSNNGTVAVSRHVLPSDLPTVIKHLDNQELNQLFAAVVAERMQRGMESPMPDKIPNKRSVEATAVSLTPGKLSAVRAAFKSGVRSVFNDEKKLSIAALSQTLPDRLIEQATP